MSNRPILVTGVPRSGTTWLARRIATPRRTALAGREPMNPRGRQYALAGTLDGWTELGRPSARQTLALRATYAGVNPRVVSRYGVRSWATALPWTRVVVKDPWALLSLPAIVAATGATPVLVWRHPAAVLASYRRVGWHADLDEVRPVLTAHRTSHADGGLPVDTCAPVDDVAAMAEFWSALHEIALDHLPASAVVVSHEAIAAGGEGAERALFERLGLAWSGDVGRGGRSSGEEGTGLHRLRRDPAAVAGGWRRHLAMGEVERMEDAANCVLERLRSVA
jgi:hypothetical protein